MMNGSGDKQGLPADCVEMESQGWTNQAGGIENNCDQSALQE